MLKAVIFDMDGTLINSEPFHFEAWKLAMAKRGLTLEYDKYKSCIGSTIEYLMGLFHKYYGIDREDTSVRDDMMAIKKQLILERGYVPLIPGVYELLKRLYEAGYLLAVASSSPEAYIKEVVHAHGIEQYFTLLCSGESVKDPKPAPDVFLKAARELGVDPEECLVVEDSMNGCKAAKAADMACIGFYNPDSGEQDLSTAVIVVEGFEEVDAAFAEHAYCRYRGLPVTIGRNEKVQVREMTEEDLPVVWEMCQIPDIASCTEDFKGTLQETREWFPSYRRSMYEFCDMGNWVITDPKTGAIWGRVGLNPIEMPGSDRAAELGYALLPSKRGSALSKAACAIALQRAKELEIEKIYCRIKKDNEASVQIARGLGFVCQGEQEDSLWYARDL
ncbi:MAG: HAD-IA family hydrolase [Lachnospiraceae bacterium]|jgi:HAD superfamily hydrolase (TIGR01509 family)